MREILFRGKRVDNCTWVKGYYMYHSKREKHVILTHGSKFIEVIPETVGQFTGLTDKNGVKIFEGDFFNVELFKIDIGYFNSVFFCENIQNFRCISTDYQGRKNFIEDENKKYLHNYKKFVIGNIHDIPELLK